MEEQPLAVGAQWSKAQAEKGEAESTHSLEPALLCHPDHSFVNYF